MGHEDRQKCTKADEVKADFFCLKDETMKFLSIEPLSGAAGDMILASLIDLGADQKEIVRLIKTSGLQDFSLCFERKLCKHGIVCAYLNVYTDEKAEHGHGHEHEHEHEHGHEHGHEHEHAHEHEHEHEHEHAHEHEHSSPHAHRGLREILALLHKSEIPAPAKINAEKVFRRLAEAEAAIHGVSPEEIHFHEVGAVDSIVDIFGVCIALHLLGVEKLFCPGHKIGYGTVRCAHGIMPVPAPATAKLLEGQKVSRLPIESELTTPTGAAILTALSQGSQIPPNARILGCGYGHGSKEFALMPNLVRSILFESEDEQQDGELLCDQVQVIEFETDDQSPESLAYLMEQLYEHSALDVSFTATQKKKNRPGQLVRVLCRLEQQKGLCELILRESSSIGLRLSQNQRLLLKRRSIEIDTAWGKLLCKQVQRPGGIIELVPEYEAARKIALANNVPIRQVLNSANTWQQKKTD